MDDSAKGCCNIDWERLRNIKLNRREQLVEGSLPYESRVQIDSIRYLDGRLMEARVRHNRILADEKPTNGGEERAASPLEVFLAGYGLCMASIYADCASIMGMRLSDIELQLEAVWDKRAIYGLGGKHPGFSQVNYKVNINSEESPEQIQSLIDMVEKACPAHNTLRFPPKIAGEVTLNGEKLGMKIRLDQSAKPAQGTCAQKTSIGDSD